MQDISPSVLECNGPGTNLEPLMNVSNPVANLWCRKAGLLVHSVGRSPP